MTAYELNVTRTLGVWVCGCVFPLVKEEYRPHLYDCDNFIINKAEEFFATGIDDGKDYMKTHCLVKDFVRNNCVAWAYELITNESDREQMLDYVKNHTNYEWENPLFCRKRDGETE